MAQIEIGMKAPDFALPDGFDNEIHLSDFVGKKVLLSWHPLGWTSVCTDQMRSLDANFEKFQALNTIALGMSVDPAPSKKAWSAVLAIDNTKLLSDFWPHGKVASDYGIFMDEYGFSKRVNIIIDEKGIVQWVKGYDLGELPDIKEVLDVLAKMK